MCLAVPMKVLSLDGATALVEQSGVMLRARVDFVPDLSPGDYVLVHAGLAISKVDEEEARETLEMLRILADNEVY